MGFFKWFKKKKENAPVENTQANEVEVSVTEESNVKKLRQLKKIKMKMLLRLLFLLMMKLK